MPRAFVGPCLSWLVFLIVSVFRIRLLIYVRIRVIRADRQTQQKQRGGRNRRDTGHTLFLEFFLLFSEWYVFTVSVNDIHIYVSFGRQQIAFEQTRIGRT